MSGPGQNRSARRLRRRGPFGDAVAGLRDARDMDDHAVDRRPSLGREDPRDRRGLGGDRPQAVDRLGRERDQPALSQDLAPPGRVRPGRAGRGRRRGHEWRGCLTRAIGSVARQCRRSRSVSTATRRRIRRCLRAAWLHIRPGAPRSASVRRSYSRRSGRGAWRARA